MESVVEQANKNSQNLKSVLELFRERVFQHDSLNNLPDQNFDDLISNKMQTLTLSNEYGGSNYSYWNTSKLITSISEACPSTGLCMAMHYYTLAGLRELNGYSIIQEVFTNIFEKGYLMASFNQPNVTVVQRNQNFEKCTPITIEKVESGYLVNGIKPTVSGAKRFDYFPVYGCQKGVVGSRFGLTALILKSEDPGVEVKHSWKMSGMKSTGSHDVELKNVLVPFDRRIGREGYGVEDTPHMLVWSRLAISSVYMGIAKAALDHITKIMKEKKEFISQRSIAFLPGQQFRYAEMKIDYEVAFNQLYMFARQAEEENSSGKISDELHQKSAMTKYIVSNAANKIVWNAMEMEGSSSLAENSFLEKLYRDVRASSFHQPAEDLLKEVLAKRALGIITPKTRWV